MPYSSKPAAQKGSGAGGGGLPNRSEALPLATQVYGPCPS